MYKDLYSNNNSEKSKQDKNTFRITKQSLNDIDDYVSSDMAKEARLDWNVSIEMMQDEVRRVKNKANDNNRD